MVQTIPPKGTKETQSTPMLRQYHAIKQRHENCILFYRLGDFYEMFFEDAKVASKVLDLVLTSRGKAPSQRIPMCGIPHHSAENYIAKLIKAGHKVAICEQVEEVSAAKGIVKRDVTRIITSGTYLDEHSAAPRFILCLSPGKKTVGLSFSDSTSGIIHANQYDLEGTQLIDILSKLPFYECVYPESSDGLIKEIFSHSLLKTKDFTLSPHDDWCFNHEISRKALVDHYALSNLHGFGIEDLSDAVASCGALLEYLKQMNKQPMRHMDRISLYADESFLYVSPAAHRGLEIEHLIKALDHTQTALGKRTFHGWFYHPLKTKNLIEERQKGVRLLKNASIIQKSIKELFQKIPDIEKNISRLSCGYTHAKDLLAIRNTLNVVPDIMKSIEALAKQSLLFKIDDIKDLRVHLNNVINEDIPLSKPEGKIIKTGYDKELDSLRDIQENGRQWLKNFQLNEIKKTGITSLKVGYNKVFGYYIEVTSANSKLVPRDYIRKQTLTNAERYITPELKEYEEKILTAEEKISKIEHRIVEEVRKYILDYSVKLHALCASLALIDSIYSLSVIAQFPGYCLPEISDDSLLDIKNGRHPVVEKSIDESFVANDTLLDSNSDHLVILTGPNMSGKSTYIRQTAILTIMAQMGSYVPADAAHIGIVDKVFTRIGAHDDISRGQSTFMVEMNEAADILNNMTDKSLVVLDEIGRGTSTFDGLSLAWALAEHLQTTKARTLFATHFHELTALADQYPGVRNYNVAVKEWKDKIVFLHKIVPGSSDDSYGIYVAKLAGIPTQIIGRAKKILTQLELKNDIKEDLKTNFKKEDQISFFNQSPDPAMGEIKEELDSIDINNLTPIDALNRIKQLKDKLN